MILKSISRFWVRIAIMDHLTVGFFKSIKVKVNISLILFVATKSYPAYQPCFIIQEAAGLHLIATISSSSHSNQALHLCKCHKPKIFLSCEYPSKAWQQEAQWQTFSWSFLTICLWFTIGTLGHSRVFLRQLYCRVSKDEILNQSYLKLLRKLLKLGFKFLCPWKEGTDNTKLSKL